jgi:hypothetical protein
MAVVLLPDGTRLEIKDLKETREVEMQTQGANSPPLRIPYMSAFAVGVILQSISKVGFSY